MDIFQISEVVNKNRLNGNLRFIDRRDTSSYVYVFFSSNNVYYPNELDCFNNTIVANDYYEWSTFDNGKDSFIFCRDIQKQWYINGVSKEIDSLDKLSSVIGEFSFNKKVICIGSSAGGFAAVYVGAQINAFRVHSFNGQFQLWDLLQRSNKYIDPVVFEAYQDERLELLDVRAAVQVLGDRLYYWCSKYSQWDKINLASLGNLKLNRVLFYSYKHGIPFPKPALKYVIFSKEKFEFRANTKVPLIFALNQSSFKDILRYYLSVFRKFYQRKRI